jgi:hypothetical protein
MHDDKSTVTLAILQRWKYLYQQPWQKFFALSKPVNF